MDSRASIRQRGPTVLKISVICSHTVAQQGTKPTNIWKNKAMDKLKKVSPRRRKPVAAEAMRTRLSFRRDESRARHPWNTIEVKRMKSIWSNWSYTKRPQQFGSRMSLCLNISRKRGQNTTHWEAKSITRGRFWKRGNMGRNSKQQWGIFQNESKARTCIFGFIEVRGESRIRPIVSILTWV